MAKKDSGAGEPVHDLETANETGFLGSKVDPTPDENYTVDGVTSGAPTPETDADAAREAAPVSQSENLARVLETPQPAPNEKAKTSKAEE